MARYMEEYMYLYLALLILTIDELIGVTDKMLLYCHYADLSVYESGD